MFNKILIANRGEIACRVIRTAKAMGIGTVAVHSDADAEALHVRMADEAAAIGPAPAADSYLRIDRIVEACERFGVDAVHPGYGFLSENRLFAQALKKAGIAFIGPPEGAIAAMGDKIESKKLAIKAGVSTVPGVEDIIESPDHAAKVAAQVGLPVMLKASAGGGGKGMRVAYTDEEVREGFASAASEAKSSFGDDRVFVEKFIERPRHIEIQVLADSHGNCIYLGERECSIQRRHQKVIEEAPSPFLDAATRQAMGEQAVALARAVDYASAGTVEFIVDQNKNFYFLEMNTRLQVEHPVTEMITGIDLVEQMIRVAAGEELQIKQEDVSLTGWAMEGRVYAEDPRRGFLPSTGRLVRCQPPSGEGVRVDTGVVEGSEISIYYDPMIAKLVCHGADRDEAIARTERALDDYYVRGIGHNIAFLSAVMRHPKFRAGDISTGFIAEEFPGGFEGAAMTEAVRHTLIGVALLARWRTAAREAEISGRLPHHAPAPAADWVVAFGGEGGGGGDVFPLSVTPATGGLDLALEGPHQVAVRGDWRPGQPMFRGTVDGRHVTVQLERRPLGFRLHHAGVEVDVAVYTAAEAELAQHMPEKAPPDMSKYLLCPMPGLVLTIHVAEGEQVKAGQPLAVVEAMKMENVLRAERDGEVAAIKAAPGDSLAVDAVILEFA
ncbi:MAG: acetyl/propionyl/methylcrotonyl-CoA carboxylase subunit alpha [Alphaproteobacteria bacterium]